MKIISKEDVIDWLFTKGLIDHKGSYLLSTFAKEVNYRIPSDSGKKTIIARLIAQHFSNFDESLLWINEFGIWPSSENLHLFKAFRLSLGEKMPLQDKPGHIFSSMDQDDIASLLSLVLYFSWGVVIAPSSGDLLFKVSHDEMLRIYSKNNVELVDTINTLDAIIGVSSED